MLPIAIMSVVREPALNKLFGPLLHPQNGWTPMMHSVGEVFYSHANYCVAVLSSYYMYV